MAKTGLGAGKIVLIVAGVLVVVFVAATALGMVPGLSAYLGFGKQKDLGVTADQAAFVSAMQKAGIEAEYPASPVPVGQVTTSGSKKLDAVFTDAEVSAMINAYTEPSGYGGERAGGLPQRRAGRGISDRHVRRQGLPGLHGGQRSAERGAHQRRRNFGQRSGHSRGQVPRAGAGEGARVSVPADGVSRPGESDRRERSAAMAQPSLVLGTAGHIDHGKSALVKALTGTDPDRLPEEKERGITIELGFAQLDLPSGRSMGVVDVPGHEKFVRQMVAGATGVDVVLLVVAADDGVMPQTREHLAIIDLLGVERGVVAITKADLVDPDWLELVAADCGRCSSARRSRARRSCRSRAKTGAGLPELLAALDEWRWIRQPPATCRCGYRSTASSRSPVRVPSSPARCGPGGRARRASRSTRRATRAASAACRCTAQGSSGARAGQRVAINIAGVDRDVNRGDIVAAPARSPSPTASTRASPTLACRAKTRRSRPAPACTFTTARAKSSAGCCSWTGAFRPGESASRRSALRSPSRRAMTTASSSAATRRSTRSAAAPCSTHSAAPHELRATSTSCSRRCSRTTCRCRDRPARRARVPMTSARSRRRSVCPRAVADELNRAKLERLKVGGRRTSWPPTRSIAASRAYERELIAFHDADPKATGVATTCTARPSTAGSSPRCSTPSSRSPPRGVSRRSTRSGSAPEAAVALAAEAEAEAALLPLSEAGTHAADVAELRARPAYRPGRGTQGARHAAADGRSCASTSDSTSRRRRWTRRESARRPCWLTAPRGATTAELREALGVSRKYAIPLLEYFDAQGVTKREGDVRTLRRGRSASARSRRRRASRPPRRARRWPVARS